MNPVKIIQKYYKINSKSYKFLISHSRAVTKKALGMAKNIKHLNPDVKFIKEASMLHDIGMFLTNEPELDCFGDSPYVCHGYLGGKILKKEGMPKHALVCERHVGAGLSIQDIKKQKIPIPKREMLPVSLEEEIICLADKFFTKNDEFITKEKSINQIRKELIKFGDDKVKRIDGWFKKFNTKNAP